MCLIMCFWLCPFLGIQAETFSQSRINLKLENVTLDQVFRLLSQQLDYEFLYNHNVVKQKGNINVNVKGKELNDFLEELLPSVGMEYTIDEKVIIIREKTDDQ